MASVHHDFPFTCTQLKKWTLHKSICSAMASHLFLAKWCCFCFPNEWCCFWHQVRDIPGLEICGAHFLRDMSDQSYLCLNRRCHSALNFSLPSSKAGTSNTFSQPSTFSQQPNRYGDFGDFVFGDKRWFWIAATIQSNKRANSVSGTSLLSIMNDKLSQQCLPCHENE